MLFCIHEQAVLSCVKNKNSFITGKIENEFKQIGGSNASSIQAGMKGWSLYVILNHAILLTMVIVGRLSGS